MSDSDKTTARRDDVAEAGAPAPHSPAEEIKTPHDEDPPVAHDEAPATPPPASGRGVKQLAAEEFNLAESIGGIRGLVESVAPGLAFVVVFIATRDLTWALIISIALAVATAIGRLITKGSLAHVFGGLVGVGIGAIWAWRTGQAEDYFVWGLYVNAVMAAATLVSMVVRWPLVGVIVAALFGQSSQWRREPRALRLYTLATGLWLVAFLARLAVQLPLYLNASVGWLGTARLVMGIPLWALVLYLSWLLVHPLLRTEEASDSADRRE